MFQRIVVVLERILHTAYLFQIYSSLTQHWLSFPLLHSYVTSKDYFKIFCFYKQNILAHLQEYGFFLSHVQSRQNGTNPIWIYGYKQIPIMVVSI